MNREESFFPTIAMAEILLGQKMLGDARRIVEDLLSRDPQNSRVLALSKRLKELCREIEPTPIEPRGRDSVALAKADSTLSVTWELTDQGLELARRKARYSGQPILRLFSAIPGPRGVRTSTRDMEIKLPAASLILPGLPTTAVHVASVGYLANTGEYVPLAQSDPLSYQP